jgi:uncharacterized protein with ATP-grasp and redox domains
MKPTRKKTSAKQATAEKAPDCVVPYRPGLSPEMDAWFTAFYIENHLDPFTHPEHAAPPEQVRFMVYVEEDERYYPCSNRMFEAIMCRKKSRFLTQKYRDVLNRVMRLIEAQIEDENERKFLETLIKIKYEHEIRDQIMIPSRLEKRLLMIFLNRIQIEDPYLNEKALRNHRMYRALHSNAFKKAMNHVEKAHITRAPRTLTGMRELADYLELSRLIAVTGERSLWESELVDNYTEKDYLKLFDRAFYGNGVTPLMEFLGIAGNGKSETSAQGKMILWIANETGEVIVDLAIIRYLTKMGHKVVIAFKEGSLFTKVDYADVHSDDVLRKELEGALLITEKDLSKNDLVRKIKSDYDIFAISDGTRENLNLLLASTTFARTFKEVDGVISRGQDQKRRLFDTHFQFTQDIFNVSADRHGKVRISHKSRHPAVIKFSHADLERKARSIIEQMADAKKRGMTVVFYSGIIGSVPGKIKTAKKIMSVFIQYLKEHSAMTFIINPSEHFKPGMDADDLMYMWEIVQRSGLIDIWRFQTYEDIAQAFNIMKTKVPPEWVGKDATFSTGCTKEMKTALAVQNDHPELQIIGPSHEKFMRRAEYGIGKMYDRRLSEVY